MARGQGSNKWQFYATTTDSLVGCTFWGGLCTLSLLVSSKAFLIHVINPYRGVNILKHSLSNIFRAALGATIKVLNEVTDTQAV